MLGGQHNQRNCNVVLLQTGVECPPEKIFELAEKKIILAAVFDMKDLKAVQGNRKKLRI